MRNEQFKTLISLLESDPKMLHDLLVKGNGTPEVEATLSDVDRRFMTGIPVATRLLNALFHDELEEAAGRDAVAACVDSCEASGNLNPYEMSGCDDTCLCTGSSTCGPGSCDSTCTYTYAVNEVSQLARASGGGALQCDENYTCSCTTYTCDGVTCGGSTCTATCTGDSCGNTCGDSCGWTTNLAIESRADFTRGAQWVLWR